jgi:hypothetical protein
MTAQKGTIFARFSPAGAKTGSGSPPRFSPRKCRRVLLFIMRPLISVMLSLVMIRVLANCNFVFYGY